MNKLLATIQDQNKKKIIYSRVVTNKMTAVAWKLFRTDRSLHFGLILYRLRRDFGFTWWELANFTGIPEAHLHQFYKIVKPYLEAHIFKTLARMDEQGELDRWRDLPAGNGKSQGYYIPRDAPAWFQYRKRAGRWQRPPDIQLGMESEKEYQDKLDALMQE